MSRRRLVSMVVSSVFVAALLPGVVAGQASAAASVGTIDFDYGSRPDTSTAFDRWERSADVVSTAILADGTLDLTDSVLLHLRIRLGDGSRLQPHTTYTLGTTATSNRVTGACTSSGPASCGSTTSPTPPPGCRR